MTALHLFFPWGKRLYLARLRLVRRCKNGPIIGHAIAPAGCLHNQLLA
ncbi:MAG: hypothetical protein AAFO06_15405 [Cyanobacteria bacterium J06597_16]